MTFHLADGSNNLNTGLSGVDKFPKAHTVEYLSSVKADFKEEWEIQDKVLCIVTDAAPEMIATARTRYLWSSQLEFNR